MNGTNISIFFAFALMVLKIIAVLRVHYSPNACPLLSIKKCVASCKARRVKALPTATIYNVVMIFLVWFSTGRLLD